MDFLEAPKWCPWRWEGEGGGDFELHFDIFFSSKVQKKSECPS